ncbi:MAG: caspase family protein [Arenicella sp.]|nr:caspase family protein [Arenicella sp.]
MYEQGLGVNKDILSALNLYRTANGLEKDELSFVSDMQSAAKSGTRKELDSLRKQVKKLEKSNLELRRRFNQSRKKAEGSTDRLQQLKIDIANKQTLLNDTNGQDDLKSVVANLNTQIEKLQHQLTSRGNQAKSEADSLKQQIVTAKLAVSKAKSSNNSDSLIALMKQQLVEQQLQISHAQKVADTQRMQSAATISGLSRELSEAKNTNDSTAVIERLNAELKNQQLQYDQESKRQQAAVAVFEDELSIQRNKLALAQKQEDSKAVISILEEQIARQQADLEVASTQYGSLQASLLEEIKERESQAELLKDQAGAKKVVASLKTQIKKQIKLLNAESKRNKELIDKVKFQAQQLAANENKRNLATSDGPTIILKVPPLVASRGINEVVVEPGQQVYLAGGVVVHSGVKSFTVNGAPAILDVNKLFMVKLDVKNKDLPVELKIIDNQNRESIKSLVLKPTATRKIVESQKKPSRKMKWGKYHALVIGNNEYADPKWANLSNAVNDAKTVASVLEKKYGFETTLILNATRVQMLEAIESMRNKLTEDDNLLIYYAGHGQRDDANNRAYWVPVDSSAESSTNWIPSYQVTDHVNAMNARHVLLVVDSCYAGLMTRAGGVNAMLVGMTAEQKRQKMKDRLGRRTRMLITAGDNTEVLDGGKQGNHSIFAEAFIAALENNTGVLDSEGVFKIVQPYVSKHTYRISKQSVVYAPIPSARHEGGEFYFNALNGE